MSSLVELRHDGVVAVIVVDNPPVNVLNHAVRSRLKDAFEQARDDKLTDAIVLACAGTTFISGADISEFGMPQQTPNLVDVIALIETVAKPVIAAMHGTPLGAGLEIALACHFRVAASGTRMGLPEIKLGLIPGAGGTQRLPRLIGVDKALRMILSGDPMLAKDALAEGLIDAIIEGDPTAGAVTFARKVVTERWPLRHVRDMEEKLAETRATPTEFDTAVAAHAKRARGLHAPAAAIQAVRMVLDVPIDEALKRERTMFIELVNGEQSKAQRHVFFAEREATMIPDMPVSVKPRDITQVAVIGAGTMGGGIAMTFADAGTPVMIIETGQDALKRGLDNIEKNYRVSVSRRSLGQAEMDRRMAAITGTLDIGKIAAADLVIEAVFEDMDIKTKLFTDLDRFAKKEAILATNTSYLDVNAIAAITTRPQAVFGMHFLSPANVMRLIEIVRGAKTAPDVLATAVAVARHLGKTPVVVGVCHGFVGNRMLRARSIQSERMLIEGAFPREIDAALVEFGFPMGPFAMGDLAGLDIGWRMRKAQGARAVIADQLCEAGRFGQKVGKGFYLYDEGSRMSRPDPEVERIITATSARLGMARRAFGAEEIVERLIFPMINEGARILEEGIALRPGDIDVIWVYGYAWPVWRGGPMYYADRIGLAHIRDRLADFAARSGDAQLVPAPLLNRLANEGTTFSSFAAKSR